MKPDEKDEEKEKAALLKRLRQADFQTGATERFLRVPNGLPRGDHRG